MMKRILFCILCISFLLTGCSEKSDAQPLDTTVAVQTSVIQTDTLSTSSNYIGTISAEGTANVVAMVSGTVEEVSVSVGDSVSAGDPLCAFDDENARLSLQNAQASLSSAQENYASAQASYASAQEGYVSAQEGYVSAQENYNSAEASYGGENLSLLEEKIRQAEESYNANLELLELGAVSQVEVDQSLQALHNAQAQLESTQASLRSAQAGLRSTEAGLRSTEESLRSAQAGLRSSQANIASATTGVESAEYQLSLYHLTAPVSGIVEAVYPTANNFFPSGNTAFVISNAKNKSVTFYVTDEVRQNLSLGQSMTVSVHNKEYSGNISEISGVVDPTTSMFQIKALVEDAQDLPDGLSVSVTIISNAAENAIIIPSDALYFENGDAYVYRIENGTAARVDVGEPLLYTREKTAIDANAGLLPGDEIITTWAAALKDGSPVSVQGDRASKEEVS